jgi:membrane protein
MVEAREEDSPAPRPTDTVARRLRAHLWRIIVTTVGSCLRHRVTGLAAEAAFFAVLSVPPLVFALAGAVGFVSGRFTDTQVEDVRNAVLEVSTAVATTSSRSASSSPCGRARVP